MPRPHIPLAYLITFTCYGTHLHGDKRGSVTAYLNEPGGLTLPPNSELVEQVRTRMRYKPYRLESAQRRIVLRAIVEVCTYKGWFLHAAHVRSNHVHGVVRAPIPPEPVMKAFKSRSSYRLNESGLEYRRRKRWAEHGSTPYLWRANDLRNAIRYVLEEQGEPMEVFKAKLED